MSGKIIGLGFITPPLNDRTSPTERCFPPELHVVVERVDVQGGQIMDLQECEKKNAHEML